MSTELVMLSKHLILCRPLLLLLSVFPRIKVFSSESALFIRWSKFWSFIFSISPSNEYSGLISFRIDCLISLWSKGLSRVFNTIAQKHQFFGAQPALRSKFHIHAFYWSNHNLDYTDFVDKVMSLLFNMLSSFVISFTKSKKAFFKIIWYYSI